MLRRVSIAFFVLSIFVHSVSYAVQPYKVLLKNGEIMVLEMVEDKSTDVTSDLPLGLAAFAGAFRGATVGELETHFGPDRDIRGYYRKLFEEDDVVPFHRGEIVWIRAFLNQRLVGWMTLLPNFQGPTMVYVSTIVVDPAYRGLGIGKGLLASIKAHWAPDAEELDLVVRRINYEALRFYEHLGFVRAPEIESDLVGDPTRCMFMKLAGQRLQNILPDRSEIGEPAETTHVRLTLSDGKTMTVFNQNPMILVDGVVVDAAKLKVGDRLVMSDGTETRVIGIIGFVPREAGMHVVMAQGLLYGEDRDPSHGQNERALLANPGINGINARVIADMLHQDFNSL